MNSPPARFRAREYYPLLIVEGYLLLTLLIFFIGPVDYSIHSPVMFAVLMALCHGLFIFGYVAGIRLKSRGGVVRPENRYNGTTYWLLFSLGFFGVWLAYKNLTMMQGIFPVDFFGDLYRGFTEPALVYSDRKLALENSVVAGSRLTNIFSFFFAFAKLLFIFYFLYHWRQLSALKKHLAVAYSLLFVAPGITAGVNSVVFQFSLFFMISILTILYQTKSKYFIRMSLVFGALFLLPLSWFGMLMSERGGGFEYFASTSPLGDISINSSVIDPLAASAFGFLYYSFVWLTYYVCQGYYGFSLILELDWQWTYGFGNSEFLQRQLLLITGVDVSPLTFQARIDHLWDETAQWHSFYGQVANDVGVAGLPLLMFGIGFLFAKVCKSVIREGNFYGLALVPIFAVMFIFFPANNQVFGYIDTLSYFVFVSVLWLVSIKTKRA